MDWWQTILTCVATLLSGSFTLVGILLTLRKQKQSEQKAEEEKIFNLRPELIVEDYKDLHEYDENEICDISVLITQPTEEPTQKDNIKYNEEDLNKENWSCVTYKFKNSGSTQIDLIRISTNFISKTVIFKVNQIINYLKVYKELNLYVNFSNKLRW